VNCSESDALPGWPSGKFRCIIADPPWEHKSTGACRGRKPISLPYQTLTTEAIKKIPVGDLAEPDAHLWLWTDNIHLPHGFEVMAAWGFKYHAPIHWIKPSGAGMWFIHRTQTILFGYRGKCRFPLARYKPNLFTSGLPKRHSEKPEEAFTLIESVSPGPRLELFARRVRPGWTCWGNEVDYNSGSDGLLPLTYTAGA
jgi:N6-adenosine-specific RNA methylase IME4